MNLVYLQLLPAPKYERGDSDQTKHGDPSYRKGIFKEETRAADSRHVLPEEKPLILGINPVACDTPLATHFWVRRRVLASYTSNSCQRSPEG